MTLRLVLACVVLCAGCAVHKSELPNKRPAHHTATGFKNLHIDDPQKTFFDFLQMRFFGDQRWADHAALAAQVPSQPVALDAIQTPTKRLQVTWLGHSTFLLQYKGINILTDPIFSDRASPLSFVGPKRYIPHVVDYAALPPIDAVVISHNHYDHLDTRTIEQLSAQAHFYVPLGLAAWFADRGVATQRVTELDWWQASDFGDVRFQALPSQHWSARGLGDRFNTLWASWSIRIADKLIWFAGDTGYNATQFKQIGEHLNGPDLALIPIGAYAPRWFMQAYHVNPQEAVKIHQDVGAKTSIGMHWGTFPLTAEPPQEPPTKLHEALQEAGLDTKAFSTMVVGETRIIPDSSAATISPQ